MMIRFGLASDSLNICVPHVGQKRRCILLPLSAGADVILQLAGDRDRVFRKYDIDPTRCRPQGTGIRGTSSYAS